MSMPLKIIETVPFDKEAYEYIHTPTPDVVPTFYKEQVVNMMLLLSRDNNDEAYQQAFPELRFYSKFSLCIRCHYRWKFKSHRHSSINSHLKQ